MNEINDGGPAFPHCFKQVSVNHFHEQTFEGMSLRDYFAGKALVAMFAMEANPRVGTEVEPYNARFNAVIAAQAYALADAMLAARKGGA